MWDIFLVVGVGFFIGYKGLIKEKGIKLNSKLQTVWLMLLIFCMGVSIGRNGEIVKNLTKYKAETVFALASYCHSGGNVVKCTCGRMYPLICRICTPDGAQIYTDSQ